MSKEEFVTALLPNGLLEELHMIVSEDEPWKIDIKEPAKLSRCFQARDLFEALRDMRSDLEKRGLQLLCIGARPDVTPSGMSRSMSGGRKAYIISQGKSSFATDMVDIFDYAAPEVVDTVQEQRSFYEAWILSLRLQH